MYALSKIPLDNKYQYWTKGLHFGVQSSKILFNTYTWNTYLTFYLFGHMEVQLSNEW